MSKAHRGKGIREKVNHGRGVCPICKQTGVKTIYNIEKDGAKMDVCKVCKATIANGTK